MVKIESPRLVTERLKTLTELFKQNARLYGVTETDKNYLKLLKLHEEAHINETNFSKLKVTYFIKILTTLSNTSNMPKEYLDIHNYFNREDNSRLLRDDKYFLDTTEKYYKTSEKIFEELYFNILKVIKNETTQENFYKTLEEYKNTSYDSLQLESSNVIEVLVISPEPPMSLPNIAILGGGDFNFVSAGEVEQFDNSVKKSNLMFRKLELEKYNTIHYYGTLLKLDNIPNLEKIYAKGFQHLLIKLLESYKYRTHKDYITFSKNKLDATTPLQIYVIIDTLIENINNLDRITTLIESFTDNYEKYFYDLILLSNNVAVPGGYKYIVAPKKIIKLDNRGKFNNLINSENKLAKYYLNYFLYDLFYYSIVTNNYKSDEIAQLLEIIPTLIPSALASTAPSSSNYRVTIKESLTKSLKVISKIYEGGYNFNMPIEWELELN